MAAGVPKVSLQVIEDIRHEPNLVLRNARVTSCYHDLADDFSQLVGSKNVSWLCFGTWASHTAGFSIRNEVLPGKLQGLLLKMPEYRRAMKRLQNHLIGLSQGKTFWGNPLEHCLATAFIGVSDEVSRGNLMVFEELAPLYASFTHGFWNEPYYSEQRIAAFVASFKPGQAEDGGQDLLKDAFQAYYKAIFAKGKARAELIFYGNLLVGLNEQVRLQGPIEGALNMSLNLAFNERGHSPTPFLSPGAREGLLQFHREIRVSLGALWRKAATEMLMTLHVPSGPMYLGDDVKTGPLMYPEELRTIDHAGLNKVLQVWDFTPNTVVGSAASDWSSLEDRMNFVADLFRSRQQDYALFTPPYRRRNSTPAVLQQTFPLLVVGN